MAWRVDLPHQLRMVFAIYLFIYLKSSPKDMLTDERGRGEKNLCEKQERLHSLRPQPRNQTCNLLLYGTTIQPTEPPEKGSTILKKQTNKKRPKKEKKLNE